MMKYFPLLLRMWLVLLALLVVILTIWLLRPITSTRSQGFQESCQLIATSQLSPTQVQGLIEHTRQQINGELATYTKPVKVGVAIVNGIGNTRLTEITMGPGSQILPCTSSCVCQKSEHFPQGAALRLVGATASVTAPDIEVSFLGGLGKVTTTIEATVRGVDATIESDCKQGLVITSVDLKEVEITKPDSSTMLGKLLAKVPQQREQLLEGLRNYVLNKVFILPTSLADTPLLCKDVKENE